MNVPCEGYSSNTMFSVRSA